MSDYVRRLAADRNPLWRTRQPTLSRLDVELTERCPNRCPHCYINRPAEDEEAAPREMTAGRVKEILTEAASLGCLSVRLTGGEPLLRPDFEEIYLFARRLGLKVKLFTNGVLLTERLAGLFARVPPLEKIEIGIYGLTAESYGPAAGGAGTYDAAWRGVKLLLERGVPFVVKGAYLPSNRGEVARFDAWAAALPGAEGQPALSILFGLRSRRDSESRNEEIRRLRPPAAEAVRVITRHPEAYRRDTSLFLERFAGPPGPGLFRCGAGRGSACVDAYGRAQPCLLLRAPEFVRDLGGTDLRGALAEYSALSVRAAADTDYLARCARCFLADLCDMCPAQSWTEHGTLDRPVDYLCDVTHGLGRFLGLLREGERTWEVADGAPRVAAVARTASDGRLGAPESVSRGGDHAR